VDVTESLDSTKAAEELNGTVDADATMITTMTMLHCMKQNASRVLLCVAETEKTAVPVNSFAV
jgi:hypothetical protein